MAQLKMKLPQKFCIEGGTEKDMGGYFKIPFEGRDLTVLASWVEEWEHVSVSLNNRCPNWREMSFVKRLFWEDDATVMQLHVPVTEHMSYHPYCLHMWRPLQGEIPLPPKRMVAPVCVDCEIMLTVDEVQHNTNAIGPNRREWMCMMCEINSDPSTDI